MTTEQEAAALTEARRIADGAPPLISPHHCGTEELRKYARYLNAIADSCELNADPTQSRNPWGTIGQLSAATAHLVLALEGRLQNEQEFADRLRRESRDEPRYRSWDERLADEAGSRTRGPL